MTNELAKPKSRKKRRPYPPKHLKKLAEAARKRKLWKKSTGPKSGSGRAKASRNAYKHGFRSTDMDRVRTLLRARRALVKKALAEDTNALQKALGMAAKCL